MAKNVYLVGFMGCGKSLVGQELAALLGSTFSDLDEILVKRLGQSIADYFSDQGEEAFRKKETAALRDLSRESGLVVATGGGAFCSTRNREIIHGSGGVSVFLDVPWPVILDRLSGPNYDRPMWRNVEQARALFFVRERWYRQAMKRVAVEEATSAREVAERVARMLQESDCAT
jgi:shikimate kinase